VRPTPPRRKPLTRKVAAGLSLMAAVIATDHRQGRGDDTDTDEVKAALAWLQSVLALDAWQHPPRSPFAAPGAARGE
jgi:hypothetical protein